MVLCDKSLQNWMKCVVRWMSLIISIAELWKNYLTRAREIGIVGEFSYAVCGPVGPMVHVAAWHRHVSCTDGAPRRTRRRPAHELRMPARASVCSPPRLSAPTNWSIFNVSLPPPLSLLQISVASSLCLPVSLSLSLLPYPSLPPFYV